MSVTSATPIKTIKHTTFLEDIANVALPPQQPPPKWSCFTKPSSLSFSVQLFVFNINMDGYHSRIDSAKKSSKPLSISTNSSGKQISTSPKPTPKCSPLQMQTADFPPDFIGLRVLWNIHKQDTIPTPQSQEILVQFYRKFSSSSDIDSALQRSTNALMLDTEEDVQDFAEKQLQPVKVACGVSKLGSAYESYIRGALDAEEDNDSDNSPDGSINLEEPSDNEEEESDGLFEPGEYNFEDVVEYEDSGAEDQAKGMEGVEEEI
ncbi:hypothetical protein O181_020042 [Austropuccinia psidii MF-1]|uniref:Uncharacterized protein n=1 Tax=Austropuccinia psidii MF-1 TaxID=1389203 RepID=A0A9Q3GUZ5_9BASI|nr:hypothetical protein [Austropuccinia psidii MF-1]